MDRTKLIQQIKTKLIREGAKKASFFGSFARKEDNIKSDIDVIVEFKTQKSLLEIARIERELSEATGKRIDLLTERSISPMILENIKGDMETIIAR
jgi:uncharacterized protein